MFRSARGKASLVLFLSTVIPCCLLVFLPFWQNSHLPEPFLVELPEFQGRVLFRDLVLPREKVNLGTFTIIEDFGTVSKWGSDGILTYGSVMPWEDEIKLAAWRPDQKTSGVFQYAEKTVRKSNDWGFYVSIGEIERRGSYLIVHPTVKFKSLLECVIMGLFLVLILITMGLIINPKYGS